MTRLDWERTNLEKKAGSRGTEPASIRNSDEMPPSEDDFLIDFDPHGNKKLYIRLLKEISEAEILDKKLPDVPREIQKYVVPLVIHYGGLLEWAKKTKDYGNIRLKIMRKIANKRDNCRRATLKKLAKFEATHDTSYANIDIPEEIKQETRQFTDLIDWAHSRPEYEGILKSAQNYAKRHWK